LIHPQSKHIIFISSAAAYLDIPSEYGERKKTLEKVYQGFCSDRGIKLTILRIFNTFGPYQKIGIQGSLIANIFKSHLLSKPIPISNLESKRDFFFAPILGPILEHVAVNSLEGIYDVASGNLYSIGGLIRLIENEVIHSPLIKSDVNHSSATFSRAGRGPLVDRFGNFNFISALKETYSSIKEAFLV
jgi:nucleoside-diphosphate-sugar epimerase